MKKGLVSIFDYRELFVNLRYLRKLRYSRKEKIPFRIKRRYGIKINTGINIVYWKDFFSNPRCINIMTIYAAFIRVKIIKICVSQYRPRNISLTKKSGNKPFTLKTPNSII